MIKLHLITCVLLIILFHLSQYPSYAVKIETVTVELLLNDRFRVSLPDDPNIRAVQYHVNVNEPFRGYEAGQMSAKAKIPQRGQWSHEFQWNLKNDDLVYIWVDIRYTKVEFRDKQGPFSVAAIRRGDRNVIVSPPGGSKPLGSTMTSSSTTTTTTMQPKIVTRGPVPEPDKMCVPADTEVSKGGKYCKGDLLFEDNFDQLLPDRWTNEVRLPLDKCDAEFVVYNGTAYVEGGILKLPAALYETQMTKGTIDLANRCTRLIKSEECRLVAQGSFYLPPVQSSRINSKKSFSFKYGRIDVRAQLPKGDWLVPLISLEPTDHKYGTEEYTNGEMRIAFSRGNHELMADNERIDGHRLFGGVIFNNEAETRHQFMVNVTLDDVNGFDEHFGNQYHLYSMIWTPEELLLLVDNNKYGTIKTNFKGSINKAAWSQGLDNAPLDQMFYLTLGLSVGGHGDFPSQSGKRHWENLDPNAILEFHEHRDKWNPTWDQPELNVDYVRVYAI